MGGTSKQLMMLLSCSQPFPLLYPPRPFALRLILHSRVSASLYSLSKRRFSSSSNNNYRTLPLPHPQLSFSINSSSSSPRNNFHAAGRGNGEFYASAGDPVPPQPFASSSISNFRFSHPWPEWSNLVDNLRLAGYFDNRPQEEDAFSVFENLPQEFVQASSACLAFARQCSHLLGSLSKKDIEVVVQNGSPFLFKSAVDTVTRMKSFLASSNHQNSELVFESAPMVDLMRFLLSYVYNPVVSDRTNLSTGEQVESSVRNLLRELAYESRIVQESDFSSSMPKQFPDGYGQTLRPIRQNIEMKRGDWICPKCTFMNFARNMNCLECNEIRPKRQLTGGEWHCPQCDFFNYGKNAVCIRCDCRRPAEVSGSASPRLDFKYDNADNSGILNTRAALSEQRMASGQYQGTLGNAGSPEGRNFQSIGLGPGKTSGTNQNLDRIFDRSSEGSKSECVPFRPLPSDMFNKPQSKTEAEQVTNINSFAAAKLNQPRTSSNSDDTLPLSKKPVNQTESKEDIEQAKKSERWFKKVAELHDVTDLASAISDEDFPEIMPMRKGENRFVVSKKKDRALTSPLHKRRMAMEQTSSTTNFVPFVPFPPDYFAKKDKVPETEAPAGKDMSENSAFASPEAAGVAEKFKEQKEGNIGSGPFTNSRQSTVNQPNFVESRVNYSYGRVAGNSRETADDLQTGDRQSWSGGSGAENRTNAKSATGNSTQQWENAQNTKESWRGGFSGKSLEGSLVKEPDPLDMSEEAKAERWFRRAAQIKDISELSQIPDEDFPQIMPMRKGVNRFVVSKRKTPLERRLTSPQYRRNLPIVSSEPVEKDNSDS